MLPSGYDVCLCLHTAFTGKGQGRGGRAPDGETGFYFSFLARKERQVAEVEIIKEKEINVRQE